MPDANHLINEKSPYLLEHAHNPVNWYPWCDEAFARAKSEDKPVFLSIGYSACHWCHVMEREVFENEAAAKLLNAGFISVKVDREERPDVDHLYMSACQELTGNGGWPLTVFMTPDKLPFFAGTYFPADSFMQICGSVTHMWQKNREKLNASASEIFEHLKSMEISAPGALKPDCVHRAFEHFSGIYDEQNGGFGFSPKFPSPHNLMFLRRYGLLFEDAWALEMSDFTLERMYLGGLFDHVGGGFFRYSTDEKFMIPHFEKMLYDNAMLAIAYAEAGKRDVAEETLRFCLTEMKAPGGGFYAAIDADSEGREGKYYLYSPEDISACLGGDAERFCKIFHVTGRGNFEGKTHLNLLRRGIPSARDREFIGICREKLLKARAKRVPPLKDTKITLSSNALMIAALASAGRYFNSPAYINEAISAARFIEENMEKNGRLYGVYSEGLLKHLATSDDYAYYAWGLFRLHQATLDEAWLHRCADVFERMYGLFADEDGLLWLAGSDVTDLPLRSKSTYDGALFSGNSVAAGLNQRLYILTGDEKYNIRFGKASRALAENVNRAPFVYTAFLSAVLQGEHGGQRVELPEGMGEIKTRFYPFATFCPAPGNTARVCTRGACLPPISDLEELTERLERKLTHYDEL